MECNKFCENFILDLLKFLCLRLICKEEEYKDILIKVLIKIMKIDLFSLKIIIFFDVDNEMLVFMEDLYLDLIIKLFGCKYIWVMVGCDDGKMWVGIEDKKLCLVDNFGNVVKCFQMIQSVVYFVVFIFGEVLCSNGYGIDRILMIQKVFLNFDVIMFICFFQVVEVGFFVFMKYGNVFVGIWNFIGRGEVLFLLYSGKMINKVVQVIKEVEKVVINEEDQVFVKDFSCIWIMSLKGEFINQIEFKNELKGVWGFVCDCFSNFVCFWFGDVSSICVYSLYSVFFKYFCFYLKLGNDRVIDIGVIDVNDYIWLKEDEIIYVLKYLV